MKQQMERCRVIEVLTQLRSVLSALTPSELNHLRVCALGVAVEALQAFPINLMKIHPNQMN